MTLPLPEYPHRSKRSNRLPEVGRGVRPTKGRRDVAVGDLLAAGPLTASPTIPVVIAVAESRETRLCPQSGAAGSVPESLTLRTNSRRTPSNSQEVVPALSRVAPWWTPSIHLLPVGGPPRHGCEISGIRLDAVQVRAPFHLEDAFSALNVAGPALSSSCQPESLLPARGLTAGDQRRLVAVASFREFAEARGLLSYGRDLGPLPARGLLIDRILKGARPSDLPVEQPARFEPGRSPARG